MNVRAILRLVLLTLLLQGLAALPAQAAGDGITGNYYNYTPPYPPSPDPPGFPKGTLALTRTDSNIDFDFGLGSPAPTINSDYFDVQWTGFIDITTGGNYTFWTQSDDGARLKIDGQTVVDDWTLHAATWDSGSVTLSPGYHSVEMDYFENTGYAVARLHWQGPDAGPGCESGTNYQSSGCAVPQSALYTSAPLQVSGVDADCTAPTRLTVHFSQAVQSGPGINSAENPANYQLSPTTPAGQQIISATLDASGQNVALTLAQPLTPGVSFTLTIRNVRSAAAAGPPGPGGPGGGPGTPLTPDPTTVTNIQVGVLSSGLFGTFYDQNQTDNGNGDPEAFTGNTLTGVSPQIDYNFAGNPPNPPFNTTQATAYSVRWTGYVKVDTAGSYTFSTVSDDGVRLRLDGNTVIDDFTDHAATTDTSGPQILAAGYHPVTLEYYQNRGVARIRLSWNGPGTGGTQVIPASNLFYCASGGSGALAGFIITAPSNASACDANGTPVTVTAVDASGQPLSGYTGTITLSALANNPPSGLRGDWLLLTGGGSFASGGNNSGVASYVYSSADHGSATFGFSDSFNDSITFTATDGSVSTSYGPIQFNKASLAFYEPDCRSAPPSVLVAGEPHDLCVVKYDNNCNLDNKFNHQQTLAMSIARDPPDPGGAAPTVNGSALPTDPASTNVQLDFSSGALRNGSAQFTLATSDVGKYSIEAATTGGKGNGNGNGNGNGKGKGNNAATGSSPVLTVRPYAFQFGNIEYGNVTNPAATTLAGGAFAPAGRGFRTDLTAVLWQNGDPPTAGITSVSPGIVTGHQATPSYNWNTALGTSAGLPHTPAAGVLGQFNAQPLAQGQFSGGTATDSSLTYSEVGSFAMQAQAYSFLGTAGADISGQSPPVGRFYPDHFDVTTLTNGCGLFTYSGQPFAQVQVTARDAQDATTHNYDSGLNFSRTVTVLDATNGSSNFSNNLITNFSAGVGSSAQATYTFPNKDTLPLTLQLAATDPDVGTPPPAASGKQSATVKSGRLRIDDAIGSELLPLPVPVFIESYQDLGNGVGGWNTEPNDACTTLTIGRFGLSNFQQNLSSANTAIRSLSAVSGQPGAYTLTLGSPSQTGAGPGANNTGSVDVGTNSSNDIPVWLRYDWDSNDANGTGLDDPTARARFGIDAGNAHVIYLHQSP